MFDLDALLQQRAAQHGAFGHLELVQNPEDVHTLVRTLRVPERKVVLLGNGIEPKIAIAALICFFPTLVNMVRGLESVNPQAMELMRVLSASKTEVFFKLRVFSSLPYLFSALRISAVAASP